MAEYHHQLKFDLFPEKPIAGRTYTREEARQVMRQIALRARFTEAIAASEGRSVHEHLQGLSTLYHARP